MDIGEVRYETIGLDMLIDVILMRSGSKCDLTKRLPHNGSMAGLRNPCI